MPSSPAVRNRTSNALFEEDWWLEAVSPGQWVRVSVEEGGRTVATWPFAVRKRLGLTVLTNPILTPYLGPWLETAGEKPANRIGRAQDLVAALIARLPHHHALRTCLSPALEFIFPLVWEGAQAEPRLTYMLPDISDPERLWRNLDDRRKQAIRRGQPRFTIRDDLGADTLWSLCRNRLGSKGIGLGVDATTLERILAAARSQDAALLLSAHDQAGLAIAAILVVHDDHCAHYLLGGFKEPDGSGAPGVLLWEAIRRLSGRCSAFDFEGSMASGVERFFRSFRGQPTTYYSITRDHGLARLARKLQGFWR